MEHFIRCEKLAAAFLSSNNKNFWKVVKVKRLRGKSLSGMHPVIDGYAM